VTQVPMGSGGQTASMLKAHGVSAYRGDRRLIDSISFEVGPGEALHVVGPNGSGKTTLLRMLCGLSRPAEGALLWGGQCIRALGEEYTAKLLYLGHQNAIKDDLSGLENLRVSAQMSSQSASDEVILDALARMGLRGRTDLPARALSQGQRRRLALSRLLISGKRLWVLDEPYVALDTAAIGSVQDALHEHLAGGGLAVLTTHQEVAIRAPVRQIRLG
jgi:heme exporter protein A